MVKVCPELFPMGSYVRQQSPGYYMSTPLQANLDIIARSIVKDMDFVLPISGNGTVRNGKSTLAQQLGTYLTWKVNQEHNVDNTFTIDNIVFKASDLMDKALKLKKYSVIVLDEGDDMVENFWSKKAKDMRRFFRKCGQLNLFVILILPDFFEMPRIYAITRSSFLINVKFQGEFNRGFFDFYSQASKRMLYIKGKKFSDYTCRNSDFDGRFAKFYTVGEEIYKQKKKEDLENDQEEDEKNKTPTEVKREFREEIMINYLRAKKEGEKKLSNRSLGKMFGLAEETVCVLLKGIKEKYLEFNILHSSNINL